MRILRKLKILLILLVILVLPTSVYAADALYRFMHNDHDALVIGEGIIGGADGPTSIYISGNPLISIIIPMAVFVAGAALGYFLIVKRRKNK